MNKKDLQIKVMGEELQKHRDKELKRQVRWERVKVIGCLLGILLGLCLFGYWFSIVAPDTITQNYIIKTNVCHNETTVLYEVRGYEGISELSTKTISGTFDLAGLEELDRDYITRYVLKNYSFDNLCFGDINPYVRSDCKLSSVYASNRRDIIYAGEAYASEFLKAYYGDNLIINKVYGISFLGDSIRDDNGKVKNLRYDKNTVIVVFNVTTYNVALKHVNTVEKCDAVEVGEITVYDDMFLVDCLQNCISFYANQTNALIHCKSDCQSHSPTQRTLITRDELTGQWLMNNCEPTYSDTNPNSKPVSFNCFDKFYIEVSTK